MSETTTDEERRLLLEKCIPEDFDGHTDFEKISPAEKLHWLSTTASFLYHIAKNNPDLGCADLFKGLTSRSGGE